MMTMEKMKRKRDHDEEKEEEARTMWVLKADDDPPWEIRPSSARPNALSQISSVKYSHIDREKTFHKSKKSQRDRDKKQRLERILYKWFLEEDKPAGKSGT